MILITSGEFVSQEMRAEIGSIPPAFLPLGNRRLFEHQVRVLRETFSGERIWLSVPDSYAISLADRRKLDQLDVCCIPIPSGLSLGRSIQTAISAMGNPSDVIRILHGDTLILDLPGDADDCIAVSHTNADEYGWAEEERRTSDETVWSGYFSFADRAALLSMLENAGGNFVAAVQQYRDQRPAALRLTSRWLDFGHVNTLFKSRTTFTTQRHFNEIEFKDGIVTKRSTHAEKIIGEAEWFMALPAEIKVHTPHLLAFKPGDIPSYSLEYLPVFPLNELYVFGRLSALAWSGIFDRAGEILEKFARMATSDPVGGAAISADFEGLVRDKTLARLGEYAPFAPFPLDGPVTVNGTSVPSVLAIAHDCIEAVLSGANRNGFMHGDLCFSNVLYDARADRLKLIDPRGLTADGKCTPYGDLRYDIAKLTHSVVGMYDHIIGEYYSFDRIGNAEYQFTIMSDPECDTIKEQFLQRVFAGVSVTEALPLTVLLFLSMIPLHKDNPQRQIAFLLNGISLFTKWRKI